MSREFQFDLTVRYYEVDAQGVVHHANYLKYLEIARIEQFRSAGYDYAEFERSGLMLVVNKIACKYHRPARFGDTLTIWLRTERARGARIDHVYEVKRGGELLAEATSTIACIDRDGRVQRIPEYLEIE
ncbi:Acyl-CoA thioester hydrolase YbgC [Posidoniimonas polymericola]|uniref:Acyl-CoA thioester hydrolase YbgC n=1 Tax=Posidoniimonas polymericola TaxID=2528002 RepID=A0A5C5XWH4_9BACT|nr:thioesterase family protein [Posidoniimonas polymericola]TWT67697.1 Acyl-CoA thioester hydrolase YbgC [Posidoniimonas polymericola]